MRVAIPACASALLALQAAAPVPRGQPVTLEVVNASPDLLECHAIAGHWYGFDLGDIEAGARRPLSVLYDRPSGMIAMANAAGRAVPLQFVYCGRKGDAWRTRSILPVRVLLDRVPPDRPGLLTCRRRPTGLDCG